MATGDTDENTVIEYLNQMVRLGFDKPSKLALHTVVDTPTATVNTHLIYLNMGELISDVDQNQSFSKLRKQMQPGDKISSRVEYISPKNTPEKW